MSLRQIAKQLGVSHTLLVLWRQGKRSLTPELAVRYHQIVTSGGYESCYITRCTGPGLEPQRGFEPTNLAITNRVRYLCATGARYLSLTYKRDGTAATYLPIIWKC